MQRHIFGTLPPRQKASGSSPKVTESKSVADYVADEMLRSAVERKFGIIGEALTLLLRFFPHYEAKITQPGQIIAFRNQIIHGYASVRDDIVWEIVHTYLPMLHREVTLLLNEPEPGTGD